MALPAPELDDIRFEAAVEILQRRIRIHMPDWTDYNESDPGITLIQLFAYLTEQIGYRLNRVPDRNYLKFLDLLGVKLRPASPAVTRLALFMTQPETTLAFDVRAGATAKASTGDPAPVFEVTASRTIVPAQLVALATTRHRDLRNLNLLDSGGEDTLGSRDDPATFIAARYRLAWDGRTPKLAAMPAEPIALVGPAEHRYVWIGLAFNPARPAGFIGQRVTLFVQLDDDEQPRADETVRCGAWAPAAEITSNAAYAFYRPPQVGEAQGSFHPLRVRADTTAGWSRSGEVELEVPTTIGPVPDGEWQSIREVVTKTAEQVCAEAEGDPTAPAVPAPVPHPIIKAVKATVLGVGSLVQVSGWLRVHLPEGVPAVSVRAIGFNVVPADNARTASNFLLGRGNGLPGQQVSLRQRSVHADTIELGVESLEDGQLHTFALVDDFDASGPLDEVFAVDPEAGEVTFGTGEHGLPPGTAARIVAFRFRYGGGVDGEVAPGIVTRPERMPAAITSLTNIVAGTGGRDAETLAEAKLRARRDLKTLGRAVTNDDYELLATQTPDVRIALGHVVALRRPLADVDGPGLDLSTLAAGALAVIVVPDEEGLFPTPTPRMLRAVCRHLDGYRLVTTEVHVVPPQYVRIFGVELDVRPTPGYSRRDVQDAVAAALESYFHVLRGGESGTGFPFGATVHHADLVALVFSTPAVARVERLTARFDGQAPRADAGEPPLTWRRERQSPRTLTGCPEGAMDVERIELMDDENVFVDTSDLLVRVVE